VRGRRWLDEIIAGSITEAKQLARPEQCTVRQINLALSLAFLTPQLVKAAVEARLPVASTSSACAIPIQVGPSSSRSSASIRIESEPIVADRLNIDAVLNEQEIARGEMASRHYGSATGRVFTRHQGHISSDSAPRMSQIRNTRN
jgi:hypothetical protein